MKVRSGKERPKSSRLLGYPFPLSSFLTVGGLTLLMSAFVVSAQSGWISAGDKLQTVGVPPIPASLAREVAPYSAIYGLPLAGGIQ